MVPATMSLAKVLISAALRREKEVSSVETLSELTGLTRRVFQRRCQANGVNALDCLRFVVCLRIVLSDEEEWAPHVLTPWVDPRTISSTLKAGALVRAKRPSVEEFVCEQQFVRTPLLKSAILIELGIQSDTSRGTSIKEM